MQLDGTGSSREKKAVTAPWVTQASIWKHSLSEFRAVLWFDDVQNNTNMVKVIVFCLSVFVLR